MSETTARLLFIAIWLPFAAMRIHYHRGAGAKPKGLSTPDEGRLFGLLRWFLAPALDALPAGLDGLSGSMRFADFALPAGWRWAGAVLFASRRAAGVLDQPQPGPQLLEHSDPA